jgi:hypothetical protein
MALAMRSSISALNLVMVVAIYNNYKSSGRNHGHVFGVLLCFWCIATPHKALGGVGMANETPRDIRALPTDYSGVDNM